MRVLILIIALIAASPAFSQIKLSGRVTDEKSRPVAGASVAIANSYDGATTDSLGNYSFSTTETGDHTLEVSVLGFEPSAKAIKIEGKDLVVDIKLKSKVTELAAVTITAGSFEASDKKKGTVLTSLDIVTTANADGDITGALKTLPGTQTVGESEGLFVRGGTAGESKIYIDGNLVNNFFYSSTPGVATRGRFNPFLFKGTLFSSGGYSALYGQALSSALILETNDIAEKSEASLGFSVIGVNAGINQLTKTKRASWGISYSYANLAPAFAIIKQQQDYFHAPDFHEADANFRIKTKKGMIKYYGYFSSGKTGFRMADIDSFSLKNAFSLNNINTFNNLTWRETLNNGWKLQAGLSASTNKDDYENELQHPGGGKALILFPQGYAQKNYNLLTQSLYGQGRVVLEKKLSGLNAVRFGADHFYSNEKYYYTLYNGNRFDSKVQENLTAAFGESDIYVNKDLAIKAGARLEHSAMLGKWNVAPRFSLAYKAGNGGQASLAYGIFYQSPERRYLPSANADLGFAKATHYILQYLLQKDKRIFRTEIFYKQYNNLYKTGSGYGAASVSDNNGKGYAKGIELFFRDKKSIKNFDYWVSYSYLDTKRDYLNFPTEMKPNFAATHTASVVAKKFVLPIKTGFNAAYTYASARPYYQLLTDNTGKTFVGDYGETKWYSSLGFSVNYVPSIGKKDAKSFTVWVLSISNVLGRDNVFGYNYGSINTTHKVEIGQPSRRFVFVGCFISLGVDRTEDAINNNLAR